MAPQQRLSKALSSDLMREGVHSPNEEANVTKTHGKRKKMCIEHRLTKTNPSTSSSQPQTACATTYATAQISHQSVNITIEGNRKIYHYISAALLVPEPTLPGNCLGYIITSNQFKHIFYESDRHPGPKEAIPEALQIIPVSEIFHQSKREDFDIVQQLKLAYQAALGVLQYGATKWLSRSWTLQDLAFFKLGETVSPEALQNLHLSTEISPAQPKTSERPMQTQSSWLSSIETHAHNAALTCLAIALLEIAHWKPLSALNKAGETDLFLIAKRLAAERTVLGRKYQDMVRKCLYCDFGCGSDLRQEELQSAVYGDVVWQLGQMIESLDISK